MMSLLELTEEHAQAILLEEEAEGLDWDNQVQLSGESEPYKHDVTTNTVIYLYKPTGQLYWFLGNFSYDYGYEGYSLQYGICSSKEIVKTVYNDYKTLSFKK